MSFHERLRQAITLLDQARGDLGDDVVELASAPLHERLARETGELPARQLRQVSVLFCDVIGSTTLIQHLSPEQVHEVMDQTLAAFTRLVHTSGGMVLQYAGDSVLAAWGTQGVHEDDAAAAVRAGLAILQEGADRAEEVQRRHGHTGFGVRAGVATGPVLLGSGVEGEHSIRGMTVHLAARMEQTAPPGTLRVCSDTWRMVRGLFDGDAQAPLQVKGRD